MRTKTYAFLALELISNGWALGQPEIAGAKWNVTLHVINDVSTPVAGAKASIGYTALAMPGQIVNDIGIGAFEGGDSLLAAGRGQNRLVKHLPCL